MSPLTWKKRLLVAESELNRVRLCEDGRTILDEAQQITGRGRTLCEVGKALIIGLPSLTRSKLSFSKRANGVLHLILALVRIRAPA